jgi:hypothetical protein
MKMSLTMGDRELPLAMPSFWWENLSSTSKYVVPKQIFSSYIMALTCKTDRSTNLLSLRSLFLMTCRASSTGT